ncbi:MAG: hypothetical protein NZ521_02335, partial [Flammeovirgaceae bacterium]|nr:hypothetical protein [Flammeovirgaceae bacterium]MDW8286971.1 hypothetical protein [Flammeovirgaceae bacterium]
MTTSIDMKPSKVVLLGTGNFPKDITLPTNTLAKDNLSLMQSVFTNDNVFGFPNTDITWLLDETDHTSIKEKIAFSAEQSKGIFYFYYTGQILIRKGRLYLTTPSSTLAMAHVNGLSLDEILEIIKESPASEKFILLDAQYHKASSEFNLDMTQLLAEIFNFYENEYPQTTFLSSHVLTKEHKNFSVCLAAVLSKGIEDERPYLSFQDVFDQMTAYLSADESPVRSSGKAKRNPMFAPNRRYADFSKIKKNADIKFDNENFLEALSLYDKALELFSQNAEVQIRRNFIALFLEVKENIHQPNFEKARQLYELSTQILALGVPKKSILASLDKIATMYFERNQYELAREYYELLLKEDTQNPVFQEKYERSRKELLFEQFVEKGDSAYFTYQYSTALENYEQALKIKRDNLVLKRKDECERFIERERKLREELEKQMTEKLFSELKNKVEEQIKSRIEEEMRSKKEEMLGKIEQEVRNEIENSFKQELEDSFWSRVTVWNTIEAYQLYKGFFPNGKYVEKATRRIDELKARQTKTAESSPTPSDLPAATFATEPKEKEPLAPTPPKAFPDTTEHKATRIRLGDIIHREDVKNAISAVSKKEEEEILPTTDAILGKQKTPQEPPKKEEKSTVEEPPQQKPAKSEPTPEPMTDKQLWEQAKAKGTIRAYMDYIENTKEYTYVSDAYFEINQLKRKGYTLENDVEPDKASSSSAMTKEQETRFANMTEEELWRYAQKENTLEAYRIYVEYTKESLHVADAYYFINQLTKNNQPEKKD